MLDLLVLILLKVKKGWGIFEMIEADITYPNFSETEA